MSTELKIVITTKNTAGSGTTHLLYVSCFFDSGPNLAQLGGGQTGQGETSTNTYLITDQSVYVRSLSIRLNGLAPSAPDNWITSHVKVTFGTEVLVDRPWELLFDNDHRSHELYRRAFDLTQAGRKTSSRPLTASSSPCQHQ